MFLNMNREKILRWITVFFSEVMATGTLVFIGCMGCVDNHPNFHPTHLTICLIFGLAVLIALDTFICVSGAHINPIVTIAAIIYKRVDLPTSIVYVIGELVGGFVGYWFVRLSIVDEYLTNPNGFCLNKPGIDIGRAFVVEFISSFIFILIVCGIFDPRNKHKHESFALRFGLSVTALAFVGGPFGGGSMNPARSFGPALYNWNWEHHWIYWVAPISAGALGTLIFRYAFYQEEKECNALIRDSVDEDKSKAGV